MFPMEVMGISQGVLDGFSHKGRYALDLTGKDAGIDPFIASFDGYISWKQTTGDKTGILFSSTSEVLTPSGMKLVNILLWHDNDISDLWKGKYIQQGEVFYHEGTAGQATGNHVHMMTSFGKYDGSYPLYKTIFGNWALKNQVHPEQVFFIDETIIRQDKGYNWKYLPQEAPQTPNNIIVGDRVMIVGTKYATGQTVPASIKKRTFTVSQIIDDKALLKEITSWVFIKDLKEV